MNKNRKSSICASLNPLKFKIPSQWAALVFIFLGFCLPRLASNYPPRGGELHSSTKGAISLFSSSSSSPSRPFSLRRMESEKKTTSGKWQSVLEPLIGEVTPPTWHKIQNKIETQKVKTFVVLGLFRNRFITRCEEMEQMKNKKITSSAKIDLTTFH